MNIVLVGKTGSGKSSICDWLTENLRYDKLRSYTTRPKREGETDEYHFITEQQYDALDLVLKTEINGYRYGVMRHDLADADCKILIVDPSGVEELVRIPDFDFVCIYVDCPACERMHRCQLRGDNYFDIIERMNEEVHMFDGFVPTVIVDNDRDKFDSAALDVLKAVKEAEDCLRQSCTK
nr:MAG TPA: Guanylate kinase [Caudoviricetes sp.]